MAAPTTPAKPVEIVKSAPKPRAKAPENESKSDKFKRLANHRVPRALRLIRAIGNLGNRAQYESTEEQRKLIINSINAAIDQARDNLNGSAQEVALFKL